MTRKKLPADITDVQEIMRSIRDKWALLILHELSSGTKRHGELRRGIRGISHKMLTEPLRNLERDRLVRRTVYPVVSPRVDYALTPLGGTLTTPFRALSMDREACAGDPAGPPRDEAVRSCRQAVAVAAVVDRAPEPCPAR